MDKKDLLFIKISKSKFRNSFHLNSKMKEYVSLKGIDKIKNDAYDIINSRIKPKSPKNDGKQTPMKQVHPVFIAQHACACCCRGCLEKWYKIPKGRELTDEEISFIVSVIVKWIEKEENV
jgi:exodeoxyribonuclease V alpha subunit